MGSLFDGEPRPNADLRRLESRAKLVINDRGPGLCRRQQRDRCHGGSHVRGPSGTDPGRLDGDPAQSPWTPLAACTDYSTITQVEQRTADAGLVDAAGLGMMPVNLRSTLENVRDGLSNTLLLVESAGRPMVYRRRQSFGTLPTNRVNGGGWSRSASDFGLDGVKRRRNDFSRNCASIAPMDRTSAFRLSLSQSVRDRRDRGNLCVPPWRSQCADGRWLGPLCQRNDQPAICMGDWLPATKTIWFRLTSCSSLTPGLESGAFSALAAFRWRRAFSSPAVADENALGLSDHAGGPLLFSQFGRNRSPGHSAARPASPKSAGPCCSAPLAGHLAMAVGASPSRRHSKTNRWPAPFARRSSMN